jgi:hypothetical protein
MVKSGFPAIPVFGQGTKWYYALTGRQKAMREESDRRVQKKLDKGG